MSGNALTGAAREYATDMGRKWLWIIGGWALSGQQLLTGVLPLQLPGWVWGFLGIILAQFLVWNDVRKERDDALEEDAEPTDSPLVRELRVLLQDGRRICEAIPTRRPTPYDHEADPEGIIKWRRTVQEIISRELPEQLTDFQRTKTKFSDRTHYHWIDPRSGSDWDMSHELGALSRTIKGLTR